MQGAEPRTSSFVVAAAVFSMRCHCVCPNLVVGRAPFEEDFEQLKTLGITSILSLQTVEDGPEGAIERERDAAIAAGMKFANMPVTDFDRLELIGKLPNCVSEVERMIADGNTVYLHCTAGVNRSPTVAVAYLHWVLEWPLKKAIEHLGMFRCCPDEEAVRKASKG
jgi:protein-tyrosine phosphatase